MVERTELGLIKEPIKPSHIPVTSQWLAGQGAGSWFNIVSTNNDTQFTISRFSPEGVAEFESLFEKRSDIEFCLDCPYAFTYLSHYKHCNIIQHGEIIEFINKKND